MPSPSEASTSRSASPASSDHDEHVSDAEASREPTSARTFESLGVIPPLLEALAQMKFSKPTEIQAQAIPYALQERDIIGVAETVSNSTCINLCFSGHISDLLSTPSTKGFREDRCIRTTNSTKALG
jgi:hypothetical protein